MYKISFHSVSISELQEKIKIDCKFFSSILQNEDVLSKLFPNKIQCSLGAFLEGGYIIILPKRKVQKGLHFHDTSGLREART